MITDKATEELADAGANFAIAVVQLAMAADDNGEYLDELERRAEERWQKIQEECERDPLLRLARWWKRIWS